MGGLVGAMAAGAGNHQPRQQQLALQARQGGFDAEGAFSLEAAGEKDFVLVEVAEGKGARQQQRPALTKTQKGFGQAAPGAPGRHQHRDAGQRRRIATGPVEDPGRQDVDEGWSRRDGEDLRFPGHSFRPQRCVVPA